MPYEVTATLVLLAAACFTTAVFVGYQIAKVVGEALPQRGTARESNDFGFSDAFPISWHPRRPVSTPSPVDAGRCT
jgi:hypothetical protein